MESLIDDSNGNGYGNGYGYGNGDGNGDGNLKVSVGNTQFHKIAFFSAFVEKNLTGKEILSVENAEQKAELIKEYGYESILADANAIILDTMKTTSCVDGKLCTYQVMDIKLTDRLTQRVVAVECHSTHKKTFLGVRRTEETKTCKGAIASTFPELEYKPEVEA